MRQVVSSLLKLRTVEESPIRWVLVPVVWQIFLYFILYFILWLLFTLSVESTIKIVKIMSLAQMTVLGPTMFSRLQEIGVQVPDTLRRWHNWIKWIAIFALLFLVISLIPTESLNKFLRSSLNPRLLNIGVDGHVITTVKNVYVVSLLPLLPILLYFFANYQGTKLAGLDQSLKQHLSALVYFVDIPCNLSIIAFFIVTVTIVPLADLHEIAIFLGGAIALLLFISNAMTVCIDSVALRIFYHDDKKDSPNTASQ